VRINGGCAAIFVLTSSGYWTKTPYTTKNRPKTEVREPLASWLSYESVKRIDRWTPELADPLTTDIEIVPVNNPLELDPGDKLRLVITLEGRPVAGAVVAYDGKTRGQTGTDGRINVKIRHRGFQIVQATLRVPVESEETDEIVHTANLNFEIDDR
jgi:nickel transport protein